MKECFGTAAYLDGPYCRQCPRCGKLWRRNKGIDALRLNLFRFDGEHRKCITRFAPDNDQEALTEQLFDWMTVGGPWWTTVNPIPPLNTIRPEAINPRRWVGASSPSRWFFSSLLFISALTASIMYFTINFRSVMARKISQPWATGFDAPDPNSMITSWLSNTQSIYVAALVVNLPQMAFSMLYFVFNATLTLMHTAHE